MKASNKIVILAVYISDDSLLKLAKNIKFCKTIIWLNRVRKLAGTTLWLMIKKAIFALTFVLVTALSAQAQKIASVDINKVLESQKEYISAQAELDELASKWKREIEVEYDKIKGLYNRYQAEQVLLSDEVSRQKEEEIMNKEKQVREMQKEKFGPDGALFQKRQQLVQPIQDRVYQAIETYAKEKGYDYIFDRAGNSGIIFANDRYDKTEDIISELK